MKKGEKSAQVKEWQKFLGLPADGDFGEKTEAATKELQKKNGLNPDGVVGAETLSVAAEIGFTAFLDNVKINVCLPESGVGFVGYNREKNGADQYGTAFTIHAITRLAAKWQILQSGAPMQIGDISRRGGGAFPPHASHRTGRDFDMRPFRKDKKRLPVLWQSADYDRVLTEEFVRFVRVDHPKTTIFFNDPVLIKKGLTKHAAGHDNHLHVRLS